MSSASSATILVVEDDPASRKFLSRALQQIGYVVLETDSGEAAIEIVVKHHPDLVILDIRLPGMSGTEVASIIRRETDVPFIFLSAHSDAATVEDATKGGALGFLVKPLDISQLAPTIRSALERAGELRKLHLSENNLSTALAAGRATSVAIGILMERYRLGHDAAFETLRGYARAQRRKIDDVSQGLLNATEMLNEISPAPNRSAVKPGPGQEP